MNYRNCLVAILYIVSLSATQTHAAAETLSLRDAIRLTLDNNPEFRTYQLRHDAIAGELVTADQRPALRISTEIENVLGTGDLNWFHGTELTFSLSQIIEFGGKRALRTNTDTTS